MKPTWVAMSVHPVLSVGKLTSASQPLIGQWLYIAPGVAWVNRAVDITPTCHDVILFRLLFYWTHLFFLCSCPISQGGDTSSLRQRSGNHHKFARVPQLMLGHRHCRQQSHPRQACQHGSSPQWTSPLLCPLSQALGSLCCRSGRKTGNISTPPRKKAFLIVTFIRPL